MINVIILQFSSRAVLQQMQSFDLVKEKSSDLFVCFLIIYLFIYLLFGVGRTLNAMFWLRVASHQSSPNYDEP